MFGLAGIERYLKLRKLSEPSSATPGSGDTRTIILRAGAWVRFPS